MQEPPDLWTSRLESSTWGARLPQLVEHDTGAWRWSIDGRPTEMRGVALVGALLADRSSVPDRWEDVPSAAYDATARLFAMDAAGIEYSVLYPTVAGVAGEALNRITDPELAGRCTSIYNDWLVDEWLARSPRFLPQCLVALGSIDGAVAEIDRSVARGHRGVVFPAVPQHLGDFPHLNDPSYDPIWALCQELKVPVCFHSGSSRRIQFPAYPGLSPTVSAAVDAVTAPVSGVQIAANFLFSPIPQKFPDLPVVFAESSLGWGAFELETADHTFERQRLHLDGYDAKPSEVFDRQCFLSGWYDRAALTARSYIGVDNILWESNFPMATSSWPNTADAIERSFRGVDDEDRDRILWGNAATLYGVSEYAGVGA